MSEQIAEWKATGIIFVPGATFEEWQDTYEQAKATHKMINWALGDALVFGEAHFEQFSQVVDDKYREQHREKMWVASRIPHDRRREECSWSLHREIASFAAEDQERWLRAAADGEWTVAKLKQEIAAEKAKLNGGYPSNQPEPVPHGINGSTPRDIDSQPEPRRNADNAVEVDAIRAMIENLKADEFDIDSYPFDLALSGWQLDIGANGKGWEVRLRKADQKQAIAINERLSAAVFEAILAARISDLSA